MVDRYIVRYKREKDYVSDGKSRKWLLKIFLDLFVFLYCLLSILLFRYKCSMNTFLPISQVSIFFFRYPDPEVDKHWAIQKVIYEHNDYSIPRKCSRSFWWMMIVLRNINVGAATTRTDLGNYYLHEIKNNISNFIILIVSII